MVKIRYARNGVALSSRTIIEQAIIATSAKFDNNIVANRFEQTTTTTYEVTIKCVSSRGKGAKRGASGRRTQSCCWHAWGTFFDELFKLNPRIVIVAQGNRITRESGNWVDGFEGSRLQSEMCDCEMNGWVREIHAQEPLEEEIPPEEEMDATYGNDSDDTSDGEYDMTTHAQWIAQQNAVSAEIARREEAEQRYCDASCRHSRLNNNGTPCSRTCLGHGNPGWEPVIPTVERRCSNCRYSMENNGGTLCNRGTCRSTDGNPRWELYVPTPTVERSCHNCKHCSENNATHSLCIMECNGDRADPYPDWELYISPPPTQPTVERHCTNCKYSHRNVGAGNPSCSDVVGRCLNMEKWELFTGRQPPTVVKKCATCKYDCLGWDTNGIKKCKTLVGLCTSFSKWTPFDTDDDGFNPDLYLQQPQVMPEEKKYMDIFGGE